MKYLRNSIATPSIAGRFAAMLLACMLPGAALGETLTCIVPDGQYVNVRNQASSTAATWGVMRTGETIEANPDEVTNGFFKTTFKDHIAYISVRYFEIPVEEHYIVEANGRVRLRKSPGGEADGFIQPGSQVYVAAWRFDADGNRWAKCTGGQYIAAQYLRAAE